MSNSRADALGRRLLGKRSAPMALMGHFFGAWVMDLRGPSWRFWTDFEHPSYVRRLGFPVRCLLREVWLVAQFVFVLGVFQADDPTAFVRMAFARG